MSHLKCRCSASRSGRFTPRVPPAVLFSGVGEEKSTAEIFILTGRSRCYGQISLTHRAMVTASTGQTA